jgi:hypothetical protein
MKQPQHPLKDDVQHRLPNGLRSLNQQIEHLKTLRQLILPRLPQGENWQVASYEQGVLCIAAEHHAAASQLRYLQAHYVEQIKTLDYFSGLHRLKVIVEIAPTPRKTLQAPLPKLSEDTKQMLIDTAGVFDDPELSEALLRIASKK